MIGFRWSQTTLVRKMMIDVHRKINPDQSVSYRIFGWKAYLDYLDSINHERPWRDLPYTLTIDWGTYSESGLDFAAIDSRMLQSFHIRPGHGRVVG
jgi:hypothetical protein